MLTARRWIGGDGAMAEAEEEGRKHERGERHPWIRAPVSVPAMRKVRLSRGFLVATSEA
jgi:hypothetical protein